MRGRVALVTGASAGIGRALCLRLAARGMHLGMAARSPAELEAAAAEVRALGVRALAVPTDVAEPDQCKRFVETCARELGGVDVLVNNAGIGMWARFADVQDLSIYERMMRINYLGAVWTTHAALPYVTKSRGLIVAISSLTGKTGVPTRSGYAASKHAMQGFFDSIRIELAEAGVDVSVISPGFVATDIRKRGFGADGRPVGESPRDEDEDTMPLAECVARIERAIMKREREVVMTTRARLGQWLKLVAPRAVDRIAARAVRGKKDVSS
ncbi:MAG: SDR family oxidoreductase [Deltaproteobacteria bacterium]|nr:SDR family oxidoreductase [Deltaproteobacteria bacterium]